MPKKIISRLKDYLYNSNYELDRRLFYLIIGMGAFVSFSGAAIAFVTHTEVPGIVSICLVPVIFAVFGVVARKFGCINFCAIASALLLNILVFPFLFFTGL